MVKGIGISLGELSVWKRKMGLAERVTWDSSTPYQDLLYS